MYRTQSNCDKMPGGSKIRVVENIPKYTGSMQRLVYVNTEFRTYYLLCSTKCVVSLLFQSHEAP